MARTTSIWALTALSTSVWCHDSPKANYTNTAVPQVPHPYWWEGPYSSSLVESPYEAPTALPLPTLPSPEEEPCETTSSTSSPALPSSEPCETHTTAYYTPVSVTGSYEPASSLASSSSAAHEPAFPSINASLTAYPTSVGVDSIASTWLPPSYTEAVPFYPSSSIASTWLGPSYTVAVPLPPSSVTQGTSSLRLSSSVHYLSTSTGLDVSSSVLSYPASTVLPTPMIPSFSAYPTNTLSTPGSSIVPTSVAASSVTGIIPVPPPQASSYAPTTSPLSSQSPVTSKNPTSDASIASSLVASSSVTIVIPVPPSQISSLVSFAPSASLSSSAEPSSVPTASASTVPGSESTSVVLGTSTFSSPSMSVTNTVTLPVSSQVLPTFSLDSSIVSSAVSSVLLSSVVVPPPSSTAGEASSTLASTYLSTLNTVTPTASSASPSSTLLTSVGTTLQGITPLPSFSASNVSSMSSSTVGPVSSSTENTSQTTRPTAAGSSVRYTLSTSATRSSSAPAETTTGVPPAPPVQSGVASALGSSVNERVWWVSFVFTFVLFV